MREVAVPREHHQTADPTRRLRFHFACNDPRNGVFSGRVEMIELQGRDWTLALEHRYTDGAPITFDHKLMRLRLHRVWFPYAAHREWVGNWCWDAVAMKRPAAMRLLRAMRESGLWHCTEAPTRMYRMWNSQEA